MRNSSSNLQDVSVKSTAVKEIDAIRRYCPVHCSGRSNAPDVIQIREDEGLLQVETTSNDILGILVSELVNFVQLKLGLHQEFLVVCKRILPISTVDKPKRG